MFKLSGKRPANLGSKNGKLAPVVKKPNNVSSQADVSDRAHYVAPLKFVGDAASAFQKLVKLVQAQPHASVSRHSESTRDPIITPAQPSRACLPAASTSPVRARARCPSCRQ